MVRRPVYNRHTGVLIPPPGPFSSPHVLYTAHGNLPGGETWSCGLRTTALEPSADLLLSLTRNAAAAWRTFWEAGSGGGLRQFNPAGTTFEGVTGRSLTAAGTTVLQYEQGGSTQPGNASTAGGGDQLALTVSLHTNLSGRHGRGRIYLPFICGQPDPMTGRILASVLAPIAASVTAMIDQINTEPDSGSIAPAVAIQSRTSGLPAAPVTFTTIGDVQDTIRGRRKKLKEAYSGGVAITPPVVHP